MNTQYENKKKINKYFRRHDNKVWHITPASADAICTALISLVVWSTMCHVKY